jgi:hypothetical protein
LSFRGSEKTLEQPFLPASSSIRAHPRFKNLATKMHKKHKEKIILHQIILPKNSVPIRID